MMNMAFSGLNSQTCFLYIGDIIVIVRSVEHHLKNLESVFQFCRKYNLKLNPYKCQFFRKQVLYLLRHRCTDRGLLHDDSNNKVILNYPKPCDKYAVKSFVAFAKEIAKKHSILSQYKPLNLLGHRQLKSHLRN